MPSLPVEGEKLVLVFSDGFSDCLDLCINDAVQRKGGAKESWGYLLMVQRRAGVLLKMNCC